MVAHRQQENSEYYLKHTNPNNQIYLYATTFIFSESVSKWPDIVLRIWTLYSLQMEVNDQTLGCLQQNKKQQQQTKKNKQTKKKVDQGHSHTD